MVVRCSDTGDVRDIVIRLPNKDRESILDAIRESISSGQLQQRKSIRSFSVPESIRELVGSCLRIDQFERITIDEFLAS